MDSKFVLFLDKGYLQKQMVGNVSKNVKVKTWINGYKRKKWINFVIDNLFSTYIDYLSRCLRTWLKQKI